MDVGAPLFGATAWQHRGYNVSVANLHERAIVLDGDGYYVTTNGDRLRLFHFHAFDPHTPDQLTTRSDLPTAHLRAESEALEEQLCVEYADQVIRHEKDLPTPPPYVYATDTRGRTISRHLRRAYRVESSSVAAPVADRLRRGRRGCLRRLAATGAQDGDPRAAERRGQERAARVPRGVRPAPQPLPPRRQAPRQRPPTPTASGSSPPSVGIVRHLWLVRTGESPAKGDGLSRPEGVQSGEDAVGWDGDVAEYAGHRLVL